MSNQSSNGEQVRELQILNRYGLHARPAALFVKAASRYDADIYVEKAGNRVSAKSIMGLMTLEAGHGVKIRLVAEGADAARALDELEQMIRDKFGEDEHERS